MRVTRWPLVGALAASLLAVVAPAAGADERPALVRIAHFAPDVSYVDVYAVSLNGTRLLPNVFYRDVSSYLRVPAGRFTYEVRPAGASPSAAPVVRVSGQVGAGRAYTAATVGRKAALRGLLIADDLSAPAAGSASVRVLNLAPDLPPVEVALGARGASFARPGFAAPTRYARVAAGRTDVLVRAAGGAVLVRGRFTARAGAVTSLALIGGAGKPRELLPVTDAVGMARMPAGGVATGGGGTAPAASPPVLPLLLVALLALASLARRRRLTARA